MSSERAVTGSESERDRLRAALAAIVARYHRIRAEADAEPGLAARVGAIQSFQSERLANTYRDLREAPRHRAAVEFFLSDLYGPADLTVRDEQVLRALGKLERFLPEGALEAFTRALEVHVLTLELDADTARQLPDASPVSAAGYARAYRAAGRTADRGRQIELVLEIGAILDRLVLHPGIGLAIRLARGPAHAAGYGALQEFIERGWSAFAAMEGAQQFLDTIATRERALMREWLA